jgi:MFS family permease
VSVYFIYTLSIFNNLTISAAQIVFSLYALQLGASTLAVGMVASSFSILPMLLAVVAGRLVDRYGARWPMLVGALGGGFGTLLPFFVPGLTALYIAGTMCGLAMIFFNLSTQNLVGLLSTEQNRTRNFSNYTLTMSGSSLLGPIIGGFAIDHSSHATACLLLALLPLVPAAMLVFGGGAMPGGTTPVARAGGGMRAMLTDPLVRRLLITGSLFNAGINLYQVYMPVYAHSVGFSASTIGMILAMNSGAAFIARFWLPQLIQKLGENRVLAYAFFFGAVNLTLIPFFHEAWILGLISFVFGLGMGCGQPVVIMLMFSSSRDGRSGEAPGLKFAVNQLTKLVSPVVFGAIATALGLLPMFLINAAIMVGGGLLSRGKPHRRG